jgi:SPP1 family predicted phage head-tail adaptor
MPTNPGLYRHLVDVEAPGAQTPDGGGGYEEGPPIAVLTQVWARIEGLGGDEQIQAMQTTVQASHRVTFREWHGGINASMVIRFEGRTFAIVAPPVDEEEKHEQLIVMTRELS